MSINKQQCPACKRMVGVLKSGLLATHRVKCGNKNRKAETRYPTCTGAGQKPVEESAE